MSLIQRGFLSYDRTHAPDYVKNGNFTLNRDSLQARNLVGWWPFMPMTGLGLLLDFSGNKFHGTPQSSITIANWQLTAQGLWAVDFEGASGDSIDIDTRFPPLLAGRSATLMAVVNADTGLNNGAIVGWGASGDNAACTMELNDNERIGFLFETDTSVEAGETDDGAIVTIGEDTHIAVVFDRETTNTARRFVNGLNTGTNTDISAQTGQVSTSNNIEIGKFPGPDIQYNGRARDVRIYHGAFSGREMFEFWQYPWDLYLETGRAPRGFVAAVSFTSTNLALNHSGASDIGGAIGAELTDDALNNIWDDVSSGDADAGDTEFRCCYVKNTHATLSVLNVKVEVATDPAESNWEIALGAAGKNGTETAVANEDTAPATPTFGTTALELGTLAAGDFFPIWIKRIVTAGAGAATPDTGKLRILGDDPN